MKTETQKLEANIWKYYLFVVLRYSTFFFIPIFVLYLQDKGFTITQVMLFQSIYALMIVFFEVPTGAVADLIGRKKTLSLGAFFIGLAVMVYAFSENFMGFAFGEILYALGYALISGADSAMIYDTLKRLDKENQFKKIYGKANGLGFAGGSVFSLASGWLYTLNPTFPILITGIPFLIAVLIALSMKEPNHYNCGTVTFFRTWKMMKSGLRVVLKKPEVMWLVIYTAVVMAFSRAAFWLYQPVLLAINIDIVFFGIVFAGVSISIAAGSAWAYKIEKKLGEKKSLIAIFLVVFVTFIFLSTKVTSLIFFAIIIGQFAFGFSTPVISDYINRHVSSKNRATVLSVNSLVGEFLMAIMLPFVGFLVDVYSLSQAFLLSAFLLFAINIILYVMRKI